MLSLKSAATVMKRLSHRMRISKDDHAVVAIKIWKLVQLAAIIRAKITIFLSSLLSFPLSVYKQEEEALSILANADYEECIGQMRTTAKKSVLLKGTVERDGF